MFTGLKTNFYGWFTLRHKHKHKHKQKHNECSHLLHKHKEIDIRKCNELQNEAGGVLDELRLSNFIGTCARYFFTIDFLFITGVLFLRFVNSVLASSPVRGQFIDVKACIAQFI